MQQLSKKSLDGNVETILLAALAEGPNYGYALVRQVNAAHAGLLQLGEGTIYPVLYRMEEKGLLASELRTMPSGRERKYYRLAAKGRQALAQNVREWNALAQVMENIQKNLPPLAAKARTA